MLSGWFACGTIVHAETQAPSRDIAEIQVGAGTAFATGNDFSPMAQLHLRYSFWRTVGLGLYVGGVWMNQESWHQTTVPLCLRMNLSMPFWQRFEPMASLGVGGYWGRLKLWNDTITNTTTGGHFALAMLFPGDRWGLGLEAAGHVFGDVQYPSEPAVMGTVTATVLFR